MLKLMVPSAPEISELLTTDGGKQAVFRFSH